ncbi:MAG: BlaI/MecI/CopY family transcriptional regulator [Chloroflexota bacterium]|nr:BlaI/MecI/CopY family transcriptional regulator [Chloroflexota bacterium]MDE2884007.1 BlaI/MecI/CopY family transcriptional regulator [Chloroflexota bacterium]
MQEATGHKAPVTSLGPLERRLMDVAWSAGRPLSVQDVVDRLGDANYKTVMTVLNRLVEKEMLTRELDGRAYRYLPTQERDAFLRAAADGLVRGYVEAFGSEAASHLADAAGGASASGPAQAPQRPLPVSYRLYHPPVSRRAPLIVAAAGALATALVILARRRKR